MKRAKGFTLVELVIVIVIVGILSVVSVPIYRGYVKKAMITEGEALLGALLTAQKAYYVETEQYWGIGNGETLTEKAKKLHVDASKNKYFTSFRVYGSPANWQAITSGVGDAAGLVLSISGEWAEDGHVNEVVVLRGLDE